MPRAAGKRGRRRPTQAERADRHVLYERAVQNVDFEVEFVTDTFKALRRRRPHIVREDFCGTANAACAWVRAHPRNRAIGVDLDPDVLDWGRRHHVAALTRGQQRRLQLIQGDVLKVRTDPVDAVLAMNFSYWCFKTRPLLKRYFKRVREHLVDDGIFFLDAYGGYEAHQELREETDHGRFIYVWDQAEYDPMSGHMTTHIHFKFPDGSRLDRAFTYHWRLWTLPELRELLDEAGFSRVTVYAQGWDEARDEPSDTFEPVERLDADAGWVACLVAEK
ncbi:MAG: hypothetical protein KatS3mg121_0503 [Gammaproteobacteria bacterium]|nr:MAG: hypothetical protein KatS3mg121_0503 [Gammaproteobacteria bacterium]